MKIKNTKKREFLEIFKKYFSFEVNKKAYPFAKKNKGISILIAMGTSLMVLGLAFATLNSISRSQEQATNIQKTTQLFYASESGIEAAFFHHNARGAGLSFPTGTDSEQTINLDSINTHTYWTIEGRSTLKSTYTGTPPIFTDILKENQTIQIPLSWDSSTVPDDAQNKDGHPTYTLDNLKLIFYQNSTDIPTNPYEHAKTAITDKYGDVTISNSFDFGEGPNASQGIGGAVLIDWSLSRKNSANGIQTFVPTVNEECTSADSQIAGFICEKQLLAGSPGNGLSISTSGTPPISGKILPSNGATPTLSEFWKCQTGETCGTGSNNSCGAPSGSTCSDYRLTFRPLLKFTSENGTEKIKGIPFILELSPSSVASFPKHFYSIVSDVKQTTEGDENFTQRIELDVNERNSIGAFDYVIFD